MYTACGGISAISAWHSPDVAFDPNHGLPMACTIGTAPYVVKPLETADPASQRTQMRPKCQNENCCLHTVGILNQQH